MKTVCRNLAFALFILPAIVFGAAQDDTTTIKAVIKYSAAPWDDAAYEILIPLPKTAQDSHPFIIIDIWGNPEYQSAKTLHFSKEGSRKDGGRADFQAILNKSMPVTLTGSVSFRALKKEHPVVGSFQFVAPDGKTFKAGFEAAWGNKPLPYIR